MALPFRMASKKAQRDGGSSPRTQPGCSLPTASRVFTDFGGARRFQLAHLNKSQGSSSPVFSSHPGADVYAPTSCSSGPSSLNNPVLPRYGPEPGQKVSVPVYFAPWGLVENPSLVQFSPTPTPGGGCRKKKECPKSTSHRGPEGHAGWYQ